MNSEIMFTRSITGLPSTILFVLFIAFNKGQQQMTIDEMMKWVVVKDDDAVRKACDSLEAIGIIGYRLGERGKKHYHLTDSSQQYLPGMMPILPAPVSGKPETEIPTTLDAESAPVDGQKNTGIGGFCGQSAPVS